MLSTKIILTGIAVGSATALLFGGGVLAGFRFGTAKTESNAQLSDEREKRIMAHIVERNPNATIKEFSGFPRALLMLSQRYDLDYRLVMALIDKESQFDPKAIGKSGEIGLMQLMPATAALVASRLKLVYLTPIKRPSGGYSDLGSLGDARLNLEIGTAFLAERIQKFGDIPTGLRAFNRGDAQAKEHRPLDRYAEGVTFAYVALIPRLPQ